MTFSVYVALGLSGECSEDTCQGCCLCHVMADQGFRIVLRVTHLHTEQLGFFFDKASQFFPGGQLVCPHDLVAGFLQNGQFMTEKGRSHNVFYDLATSTIQQYPVGRTGQPCVLFKSVIRSQQRSSGIILEAGQDRRSPLIWFIF